jgi:predicted MFS family arabinose efflux permease
MTVALTALVFALVEGNSWGWGSPAILGLFALSIIAFAAFVAIERRAAAPVVDFEALRSKQFLGANVIAFMVTFGMLAMFFFLALYMQNILGYGPLAAGVRFLPSTVVIIFAGPIAGRLADRFGPRPLMVTGMLLTAVSLLWQSRIEVDTSYAYLAPAFAVMGLGIGLVMSPMSMAAMNAVDRSKAGVASGTLSMFRMVGGTFGVAVLGALVAAVGRHDLEQSLPQLPSATREALADGLGSGAGLGDASPQVVSAAREAFVDALGTGLTVSAIVVATGAALAWLLIAPARPGEPPAQVPDEAAEAELVSV